MVKKECGGEGATRKKMRRGKGGIPRKMRFVDDGHYPASGMATTVGGVDPVGALIVDEKLLDDMLGAV